jgi:hypothetical protein
VEGEHPVRRPQPSQFQSAARRLEDQTQQRNEAPLLPIAALIKHMNG